MKLLIAKGADVNYTPKDDYPPLHCAVFNKDKDMVELLIDNGAKFDVKDQGGWTAFRHAASRGNRELVEFFVAKGADVSSFHMAAYVGDLTRVKRFVEQGTDVNTKDNELKWTPLHWAVFAGYQNVVEFLLAKGANINAKDEFSGTPLHHAAGAGAKELVKLLLAKGANVNAKTEKGQTAMSLAKKKGHSEIAELLHKHGAEE